jgi:hypothetical protein
MHAASAEIARSSSIQREMVTITTMKAGRESPGQEEPLRLPNLFGLLLATTLVLSLSPPAAAAAMVELAEEHEADTASPYPWWTT